MCTSRIRKNEAQLFLQQFEHLQSTEENVLLSNIYREIRIFAVYLIEFFKFWEIHRLIISSIWRHWVSNNSWFFFDVFIVCWYRCDQWCFQWSCKNYWFTLCSLKIFFIENTFDRICINQRSSSPWTCCSDSSRGSITSSCSW